MGRYIVRRVVWMLVVMAAVTFITYAIFFLLPSGDPAQRFAGKVPDEARLAEVRAQLGLDKPWYEQYGIFVRNLFAGDEYGWPGLGKSFETGTPVREGLADRLPRTLSLV